MERPDFFTLHNGDKAKLPFTDKEYQNRVNGLREAMSKNNLDMIILTSMHNIAYYTGFIYCKKIWSFHLKFLPILMPVNLGEGLTVIM